MAVTTTVQMILNAAYSRSTQNNPGTIATESTELLAVVQRALDGCYAFAARINPTFFADTADVVGVAGVWARPEAAESIFLIEEADGTEVAVVPYNDRTAEELMPSVYEFGQNFYKAGNTSDPGDTDTLTFYFASRPATLTALSDVLDAMWREQFNELLELEVAIYLATKDGAGEARNTELQVLAGERNRWANRMAAHLEHATANLRRRYGHIQRINTEALLPILGFADVNVTK
jgi:hypothetical protein